MWFGQPGKAGKARRDTPSDAPRGRTIAGRVRAVPVVVRDAEPIGTALMASLGILQLTQSPASRGGGHAAGVDGAGQNRDTRRTGALQGWTGAGAPVASDRRRAALGAQGGPSSQPAYPSTGNAQIPSLINPLSGLPTPYGLRFPAV